MAQRPLSLALTLTPQSIVTGAFLVFVAVTMLGGGSARVDVAAVMPVRLAAVGLIAAVLLLAPAERLARARAAMVFVGLCALLVALQLVPLPPAIWSALPGRARYAFDVQAGFGSVWRPLSLTPDLTVNTLLALLPATAAALWMRIAGQSTRPMVLLVVIACGLLSAVLGLLQLGAGPGTPLRYYAITNPDSAVGLFANRNHNAMLLAIVIPALACWAGLGGREMRETGVIKSWIALGAAIFLLAMAAMTGSRGGLVLAVATSAIGALLYWQLLSGWRAPKRVRTGGAAARWLPVAGAALALVLAGVLSRTAAFARLLQTDPLDEQRGAWLAPLTEMFRAFFPVGAGFGSFDSIFRGFEPFEMLQTTYLNAAHNDLLQLAIEGGVGGLALLGLFLCWWGMRVFATWRAPLAGEGAAFARLGSVMTGTMMVASLFDYPLRTPIHAVVFAIACGWLWYASEDSTGRAKEPLPALKD